MPKTLRLQIVLMLICIAAMTAQAAIPKYDALVVFGDSYCDVGNLFLATGGAEAAPPYYKGRFSNGPIWLDHVAGFLNVPLQPSLIGGTDYAFGGAWVTQPASVTGVPSVVEQVELYLSQHKGKADPNALYILEGGGNDIIDTTTGTPEQLGAQIAEGLAYSEYLLRLAGANHFVIPDLFNVGLLPATAGHVNFATAASLVANQSLDQLLAAEQQIQGIQIVRMNVFNLFKSVATAPTHFGFTDITNPCLTTTVCADPDHTLFWDTHHPTEFGHAFFAVTLENVLATPHDF